jgi:hypothetical protein
MSNSHTDADAMLSLAMSCCTMSCMNQLPATQCLPGRFIYRFPIPCPFHGMNSIKYISRWYFPRMVHHFHHGLDLDQEVLFRPFATILSSKSRRSSDLVVKAVL